MRSRTSLFKPVLIKTNLKQFWPVSLICLIALIFLLPVPLADIFKYEQDGLGIMQSVIQILSDAQFPVFPILAAAAAAFTCFFYLFSARSSNMIHALPLDRRQLFASNFVSGLILVAVPGVIAVLISSPFIVKAGLAKVIIPWLLTSFACFFIFYVIAVLSCILAGHTLAALVYYAFFNLAEGLIVILCRLFLAMTGFGLSDIHEIGSMGQYVLSPAIFISGSFRLNADYTQETAEEFVQSVHYYGLIPLLIYVAACIFITILALYLYKKRRLETVQEMSAFAFMRPLMRWVIAFGVGTVAAFAVNAMGRINFTRFLVLLIIFALLSFFAVEMVLRKTFRIFKKRTIVEAAACAVCISAVFIALRSDALGIANRIPDPDDLSAAGLYSNILIVKEDREDIEKIEDIHKLILENKSELVRYQSGIVNEDFSLERISFTYCGKDGRTISRSYFIPQNMTEIIEPLNDFESDASMVSDYIFGINSDDIVWDSGNLFDLSLDSETADAVYPAYKEDLEDGNITWQTGNIDHDFWAYGSNMTLTGTVSPALEAVGDNLTGRHMFYSSSYFTPIWSMGQFHDGSFEKVMAQFYVTPGCTHTVDVLIEAGLIKDADELRTAYTR